jgi:hypothetical protein
MLAALTPSPDPFLTAALTIVGGVLVFVTSVVLRHQAKITNGRTNDEIQADLKNASSQLLVNSQAIPFYPLFAALFRLPSKRKLLRAAQGMNLISSRPAGEESQGSVSEVYEGMKEIKEALRIRIDYRG